MISKEDYKFEYNSKFGDNRECECGHTYYRHFDTYENMEACGCKYCGCYEFTLSKKEIREEKLNELGIQKTSLPSRLENSKSIVLR